jgi:two-component system chemotaxis sensor kinase CheA
LKAIMSEPFEAFVARIDAVLGDAAREIEPSRLRALMQAVAALLVASNDVQLTSVGVQAMEATRGPDASLADSWAHLDAMWNGWKAAQIAGDAWSEPADMTPDAETLLAEMQQVTAQFGQPGAGAPAQPAAAAPAPVRELLPELTAADEDLAMLAMDPELAGMFFTESLDHLSSIESLILQLESEPGDQKLLNDVFRPFHTIKGNAGALGIARVQQCAHKVENLLDLGRSGKHAIGATEIEVILRAVDVLTTMIRSISALIGGQAGTPTEQERVALMDAVEAVIAGGGAPAPQPAVAEPAPAASVATASEPAAAAPSDAAWAAALQMPVAPAAAVAAPSAPAVAAPPAPPAGKPAAARTGDDPLQASVKVDTRKLDNLVDTVGELVIVQSMIQVDPALMTLADERLSRNLAQLKRITTDLQRNAMAMRMTPIRPTFQKMSRLVRDLAKKSGKQIELVLSGEDTELDRKVVEDINDPLMHMVRNSVDHGIESREKRTALGKPGQARVSLSAYHEGGNIVIAIADDGAGLNTEKIRAKAIAQGLIDVDQPLDDAEIHHLIFMPGFSTADQVTEISGRGVGMDVVRRNIEALRGRVEITTALGQGTTFYIKLPLTLAILEGLLLKAGTERFVLPTFCVRESLRPTPEQVHAIQGRRQMIKVRDSLLPLVPLGELLGEPAYTREPWEATVVVIDDNGRRVGLMVDELLGKQEVVIKSLGEAFAGVKGVAGGAILGDGRIGLILDAGGLVALMDRPQARAA